MTEQADNAPQLADTYDWVRFVARIQFGKAPKRPAARTIKLVAFRIAWYADPDGTRVYPGIARLVVDCELDYSTVKDAYAVLRNLGLISLRAHGSGPQGGRTAATHADEYCLTIPPNLVDGRGRVRVLDPDEVEREIQRIREANRRRPRVTGAVAPRNSLESSGQATGLQGVRAPVMPSAATGVTGGITLAPDELRGESAPSYGGNSPRVPTSDQTTNPTNQDHPLPQRVTSRDGPASQDQFSSRPSTDDCPTCGTMLDPDGSCFSRDCPDFGRTVRSAA